MHVYLEKIKTTISINCVDIRMNGLFLTVGNPILLSETTYLKAIIPGVPNQQPEILAIPCLVPKLG